MKKVKTRNKTKYKCFIGVSRIKPTDIFYRSMHHPVL